MIEREACEEDMKHIVFVLSGYYPYFSAVGTCVNHVVSCLKTRYHITILSVKNHCGQSDEDYLNGCHILRVDTKQINHRLYVEDKIESKRNAFFRRLYLRIAILTDAKIFEGNY